MKLSTIYGKKTVSTDGKEGYVISVLADGNMLSALLCADDNENEFLVNTDDIRSIKTKITYKDGKNANPCGKPLSLGKPVYDCNGNYIGKLTDFIFEKTALVFASVGNKKFSCEDIIAGDAVIIKSSARVLKDDVYGNGKIIIRRGTPLTPEILKKAQTKGEYIQTNLKTI